MHNWNFLILIFGLRWSEALRLRKIVVSIPPMPTFDPLNRRWNQTKHRRQQARLDQKRAARSAFLASAVAVCI
jgi:hypothetical protein